MMWTTYLILCLNKTIYCAAGCRLHVSGYKTPKNKTPKITKSPKLLNAKNYKMSKITQRPKLQNVQGYKTSKVTTFWFFCTISYVDLT